MDKKLLIDRDVKSFQNPDDAKFFGEVCKDIIKDETVITSRNLHGLKTEN